MEHPKPLFIFRMVHWRNIGFILQNGLCCRDHFNADPDYISIGHRQLISDRHNYPVKLSDGGTLGEYVPFYFSGHSPMLYSIWKGYGVDKFPQDEIVFVVVRFDEIKEVGLEYVYTDRNAKIAVTKFYRDPEYFNTLRWDVIQSRDWKNTENDLARKDYKQAEFLIRNEVPVKLIHTLVVKTEEMKNEIAKIISESGGDTPITVARPGKLYF